MADAAPVAAAEPEAPEAPSLETRISWVDDWLLSTLDARQLALRDEQYYYGKQWTPEEAAKLKARKQPITVRNLIRGKINSIRGEEIDKRVDPVAKPRSPAHEDEAKARTDALRFVEEDQDIDSIGGDALLDGLNAGIIAGIVETDSEDGYRVTVQHIPWNQIAVDPKSRRRDCSDAKWIANIQWFDLDDAEDLYPDSVEFLRSGVQRHAGRGDDETTEDRPRYWFDGKRKRVKVCEMYYRAGKNWYRVDFTDGDDLREPCACAYLDPRTKRPWCPIIVCRVYVDDDNQVHGITRDMISPQDEINKRYSKWMHQTNTKQVIYEDGAVPDLENFQLELAKPDGAARVNQDALKDARIQINTGADMTPGQVAMLQDAKQALDVVGPSSNQFSEIQSGRALAFRMQAATRQIGPVFEIFSTWRLKIYQHVDACIMQFWTDELWLRVTDDETTPGYRWVGLNRRMTRGQRLQELLQTGQPFPNALQNAVGQDAAQVMQRVQQVHTIIAQQAFAMGQPPPGGDQHMLQMVMQDPAMQVEIIHNKVGEAVMDITIHEAPESAVLEDEEFAKLADIMPVVIQHSPQLASLMTRLLVRVSAFRDKKQILAEMDKPPDKQQQQLAEQARQLQLAGAQAGVSVQQSQAQLNAARAAAEQAKSQIGGAKAPAEIAETEASAMHKAAHARQMMWPGLPGFRGF